jgi:thiamine pyrophosphokinase
MKKVVFVLSGGPMRDAGFFREQRERCQPVSMICADGGARHAYRMGLVPDLVIGDMDSLEAEMQGHFVRQGCRIMRYPRAKNETDTELAMEMAFLMAPDEVLIFGAIGARLDHTLANLSLLVVAAEREIPVRLVDEWCEVFAVKGKAVIEGEPGQTVSLFPFGSDVTGITLEGFEYPLTDATMTPARPYGISNRLISGSGAITVESGHMLVIRYIHAGRFPEEGGS